MLGTESKSIKKHETFLEKTTSFLHPHHYQCLIAKRLLSQLYGMKSGYEHHELSENRLQRKINLCNELLGVIEKIDKGYSQFRGLTLYELFKAKQTLLMKQSNVEATRDLIEEHRKSLKEILMTCVKCLEIECEGTHPRFVAGMAAEALREVDV